MLNPATVPSTEGEPVNHHPIALVAVSLRLCSEQHSASSMPVRSFASMFWITLFVVTQFWNLSAGDLPLFLILCLCETLNQIEVTVWNMGKAQNVRNAQKCARTA